MITASGILFTTPENKALFLKRGAGGDYPGYWCLPGGTLEAGETIKECALREAKEELGPLPKGMSDPIYWVRSNSLSSASLPAPIGAAEGPPMDTLPGAGQPGEKIDFTTFISQVGEEFAPKLNGEHVGWAWAPLDQAPQPLHPGVDIALRRFGMHERQIAEEIASGNLTSPQKYENVWLFAIRITGTGVAFRKSLNEFVWRDPALYMNQQFLDRCLGLAVIMEHPKKAVLNSEEFSNRVVGSVVLPYLKPEAEEVWAIAKIYDEPTALMMDNDGLSTSPAVVFRNPSVNNKLELESGHTLLIEGEPSLLDHIAICGQGVWDKGGAPSGVQSANLGEIAMADKDTRAAADSAARKDEDELKMDADAGTKLDKLLAGLDSLCERMDSFEEGRKADAARMDAFEKKDSAKADAEDDKDKDEKKSDADDKEEKKDSKKDEDEKDEKKSDASEPGEGKSDPKELVADKKKDTAKKDEDEKDKKDVKEDAKADAFDVRGAIKRVEAMIPKALSDADYKGFADAQERADHVFMAFGDSAPRPLQGEDLSAYRVRLASKLKTHSPIWKDTDLNKIADSAAFKNIEDQVYSDAQAAALRPADLPRGKFRELVRTDSTGRRITTFAGSSSFVAQFKQPTRRVQRINTNFDRR